MIRNQMKCDPLVSPLKKGGDNVGGIEKQFDMRTRPWSSFWFLFAYFSYLRSSPACCIRLRSLPWPGLFSHTGQRAVWLSCIIKSSVRSSLASFHLGISRLHKDCLLFLFCRRDFLYSYCTITHSCGLSNTFFNHRKSPTSPTQSPRKTGLFNVQYSFQSSPVAGPRVVTRKIFEERIWHL